MNLRLDIIIKAWDLGLSDKINVTLTLTLYHFDEFCLTTNDKIPKITQKNFFFGFDPKTFKKCNVQYLICRLIAFATLILDIVHYIFLTKQTKI